MCGFFISGPLLYSFSFYMVKDSYKQMDMHGVGTSQLDSLYGSTVNNVTVCKYLAFLERERCRIDLKK